MADRQIIYTLENVTTVDHLNMQQNYYIALSRLMGELINSPALGGFLCTPTVVPSLNVDIAAGEIYSQQVTDATDYGVAPNDIAANPALILKQGIYNGGTFSTPAPATPGDSIKYLIQIAFDEVDNVNESRLFKVGGVQNVDTKRQDIALVQIKAGTPAPVPVVPTPDIGFEGAWVITVAYGQTTVTAPDIAQYTNAPVFGSSYNLAIQDMLSKVEAAATYLTIANAAATYLSIVNAAATYAPRPNVGNNGYVAESTSPLTAVGTSPTLLPLNPTTWISGGAVNIPFTGLFDGVAVVNCTVNTVSPDTISVVVIVNGVTIIGGVDMTFDQSGTLQWTVPFSAAVNAGDTIEVVASQSVASLADATVIWFNIKAIAN